LTALERRVYSDRKVSLAAVSQRTGDLLAQFLQRRDACVIPNGVDTRQFSASARLARRRDARRRRNFSEADFVLLLIGNDWRVKGLPAILAAMAAARTTPLHLLVAGDDEAYSFRKMAERLDIRDRCQWETPRADVIDLYAAADAYVSPSREDSFGLPVAEAMACGLPVVTSVFAGVSSSIRNGVEGFILDDPRDSEVLATLLVKIHGDEALRRRVGEAAAKAAQNWTWDRNAEAVWQFLKDAAARKREAH
jgi:UDP-glucose:(heptosyl)LPS alpha-1,3-glucosyltransferase